MDVKEQHFFYKSQHWFMYLQTFRFFGLVSSYISELDLFFFLIVNEDEEESYKMFRKPLLSGVYYVPFITVYNM